MDVEKLHRLFKQDEVTQALVAGMLREQGLDPNAHEATSMTVYRIMDGALVASIVVESVRPHTHQHGRKPSKPKDDSSGAGSE